MIRISGTGMGVPARSVTNAELAAFLDTSDEWITSRTGIKSRFVATSETLTELSERAARQAMDAAGLTACDIDTVIACTIGGDYRTPSLACAVAERLGAKGPAFDVNAACTGMIYALDIAALYINAGRADNILIVCAEMMSRHVDWADRGTCVLFGDGAAACAVTRGGALRYIKTGGEPNAGILNLPAGGGCSPFITEPKPCGTLRMEGQEVFKFAVRTVEREISEALGALSLTPSDVDWFILHQANKRIIDAARSRLKLPERKFPLNLDRYANTSAAATPLLLHEMAASGRIKPGDTLLLCAFGSGMTTGTCVLIWE